MTADFSGADITGLLRKVNADDRAAFDELADRLNCESRQGRVALMRPALAKDDS